MQNYKLSIYFINTLTTMKKYFKKNVQKKESNIIFLVTYFKYANSFHTDRFKISERNERVN